MMKPFRCCGLLLGLAMLSSCAKEVDPNRKPTSPVTGQVTIDGKQPGSPVKVECHNLNGIDQSNPTVSGGLTKEDGTFSLSTYKTGDGVPAGKYVLTFTWGQWNYISNSYGGQDKLNGRYSDPETSEIRFEVDGEEPVDLGTIALTTE